MAKQASDGGKPVVRSTTQKPPSGLKQGPAKPGLGGSNHGKGGTQQPGKK